MGPNVLRGRRGCGKKRVSDSGYSLETFAHCLMKRSPASGVGLHWDSFTKKEEKKSHHDRMPRFIKDKRGGTNACVEVGKNFPGKDVRSDQSLIQSQA